MSYCTQQDLELRIGTASLRQLTNDTWTATPPVATATPKAGGTLSGTFYYVVTALGDKGQTLRSNEVTFTSGATNKTATLTWTAVATATSYKIYKSSASGAYTSPSLLVHQTALTYDDTGSVATMLVGTTPTDASLPDSAIVAAMIEKADREIDAYAGQVWSVPFVVGSNCTFIPSIIKQISIDFSVYNCFLRRFSSMEVPKQWIQLQKDACTRLEAISNQELQLDGLAQVSSDEADIVAPDRILDFNNSQSPTYLF